MSAPSSEPTLPGAIDGPRILCVTVPLFPLAARLRVEPELLGEAVAVLAGNGAGARVVAATRRARRAGVRSGFTLAQGRARLPNLIARPRDIACEQAAQEALLDVAESFSPRVEDAAEGLVYLDITGLHRHYPGDEPELDLARAVRQAMEKRARLPVRVGVGASKLAARVAAEQGDDPTVVPAGREADFLSAQPLERLTDQASTLSTLERWGIRRLGDLARLPQAEVVSRLGRAGEALHRLAAGEDPHPLQPRTPPPTFREGMDLEWPLVSLEPFLFVARAALERLTERMRGQGLGCKRIELSLELEPDGRVERRIELPAPTRDVKTLLTLLRLDLEANPPGAPLVAFTLVAHPDRPRAAQLSLFGPEALSPDKLATTLARLFSLLGEDRVGSPRPADTHRPEGFDLVPFAPPPPPTVRREPRPGRGLLHVRVLRPALPIEVMTTEAPVASGSDTIAGSSPARDDAGGDGATASTQRPLSSFDRVAQPERAYDTPPPATGRPVSLRTLVTEETSKKPKIHGAVRVASGPWALEEAWWSDAPQERDYWDVELSSGGLYRIYRDRTSGDWFLDGAYE